MFEFEFETSDSPEIPGRGETSEEPALPSGRVKQKHSARTNISLMGSRVRKQHGPLSLSL